MAGKRNATSELNHDNWDQDEEPEDAGTFQKASEESLKHRIIKTARRRNPISSVRNEENNKKSAFTGFTAFSKSSVPVTSAFSFLSNITEPTDKPKTNGTDTNVENSEPKKNNSAILAANLNKSSTFANIKSSKNSNGDSNVYFSKLKGLNESVSNWIKKHVDANPLINLQPIFKDYEKYFKQLEKEENSKSVTNVKNTDGNKKDANSSSQNMFVFKAAENIPDSTTGKTLLGVHKIDANREVAKFSYGSAAQNTSSYGFGSTPASSIFSFGKSNLSTSTMSTLTPLFSFGTNTSISATTGLNFSGSTPFTFNNVVQPSATEESKKDDAEDDKPPKVDFTPVVEKDYIYTVKCKVFVKKGDGNYGDRGVGNLYLKKVENSNKVQLIVRADTNLGNLLCNFILSECIPTKRIGKKDVMLVCLPTPDVKPPPVPILLRVKSPEEADNLLEVLEKHKK